jgi:hypothetical protein
MFDEISMRDFLLLMSVIGAFVFVFHIFDEIFMRDGQI